MVLKPVVWCRFGILRWDRGGWSLSCGYQLVQVRVTQWWARQHLIRRRTEQLLMLASQQFEEQQFSTAETTLPQTHFAAPKSKEEIIQICQTSNKLSLYLKRMKRSKLWQAKVVGDHSPHFSTPSNTWVGFTLPCVVAPNIGNYGINYVKYNLDNPEQCFVCLFKLYNSLCPTNQPDNAFYLSPLSTPKSNCFVLACSSWTHWVEKCSCKHVHAGRYPGIPLHNTNHSYQANEDTCP